MELEALPSDAQRAAAHQALMGWMLGRSLDQGQRLMEMLSIYGVNSGSIYSRQIAGK